jgi:branched-chain amino acid aminotransferase
MIHRYVHHNGRMLPIEEARLSPGQAGLLSGWGLFTTLRVFHGVPFEYERHWRRLERDAARTRLPFPFDAERVRAQVMELVRANEVLEGTARIFAIYNKFGFWQSDEPAPQVDLLLYTGGLPPHTEPGRLDLREHGRHAASPLAGVKVTSWLNNVWSLAVAQERGFNEVVMLNERGEAAECTTANIFCVRRGTVETPPLSSGCLEGVTRGLLLELAPPAGVPMIERTLSPEDLFSADEIFITSTNRSLLGIGEIAGHSYAAAPGPVTQKLEKMFAAYMNDYVAQHAVSR